MPNIIVNPPDVTNVKIVIGTTKGGESAYQLAVKNGFVGTEQQWLASIIEPATQANLAAQSANSAAQSANAVVNEVGGIRDQIAALQEALADLDFSQYTTDTELTQALAGLNLGQYVTDSELTQALGNINLTNYVTTTALTNTLDGLNLSQYAIDTELTQALVAKVNKIGAEDIEITDATKGFIKTSPDGSRWRIMVDNAGVVTSQLVSSTQPEPEPEPEPEEPEEPEEPPVATPFELFKTNIVADGGQVVENAFTTDFSSQHDISRSEAEILLLPGAVKPGVAYGMNAATGAIFPFTFQRNLSAAYFDNNGYIKTAPANTPRYEYDPLTKKSRGYLLEPAATNMLLKSRLHLATAWLRGSSGSGYQSPGLAAALQYDQGLAPNNVYEATYMKLDRGTTGRSGVYQPVTVVAGQFYTCTTYVKPRGTTTIEQLLACVNFGAILAGSDGSQRTRTVEHISRDWYKITHTDIATVASGATFRLQLTASDPIQVAEVWLWETQMELGKVGTSIIHTESSAVTRPADVLTSGTEIIKGEAESTNLLLKSSVYNSAKWLKSTSSSGTYQSPGVPSVITLTYGTDPNGGQNGTRLQLDRGASGRSGFNQPVSVASDAFYTASLFVKPLDGTTIETILSLANFGTLAAGNDGTQKTRTAIPYPNGWYRLVTTDKAASSTGASFRVQLVSTDPIQTLDCLIWEAQLEPGTNVTSVIHTETTQVTRPAGSTGSLYVEYTAKPIPGATSVDIVRHSANPNGRLIFEEGGFIKNSDGTNVLSMPVKPAPALSQKVAITFEQQSKSISANGEATLSGTFSGVFGETGPLILGDAVSTVYIKALSAFPYKLQNTEIKDISGYLLGDVPTNPTTPGETPTSIKASGFPLAFMTKRGSLSSNGQKTALENETIGFTLENDLKPGNTIKSVSSTGVLTFDFTYSDPQIIYAKSKGLKVHGHCLLWVAKLPSMIGDYVKLETTTVAQTREVLRQMIQEPILHFKNNPDLDGVIVSWDVINEPTLKSDLITSTEKFKTNEIFKKLGAEETMKLAFQYAWEADNRLKYFINDFDWEYGWRKLDEWIALTQRLRAAGCQVHGFGLQFHTDTRVTDEAMRLRLETIAATGLLIHISEIAIMANVNGRPNPFVPTPEELALAGRKHAALARYFLTIVPPSQQFRFTYWGIHHASYYRNIEEKLTDIPLLINNDFTRSTMYNDVLDEIITIKNL